jgi:hypothetical protein
MIRGNGLRGKTTAAAVVFSMDATRRLHFFQQCHEMGSLSHG